MSRHPYKIAAVHWRLSLDKNVAKECGRECLECVAEDVYAGVGHFGAEERTQSPAPSCGAVMSW
jgi:hypothetical protein